MDYIKVVIDALWAIANFELVIGGHHLKLWYFQAWGIILGVILKLTLGEKKDAE